MTEAVRERRRVATPWIFRLAMSACVFAFGPSALAEDAATEKPALSQGWTFAEQGGAAIYANVCAACHQPDALGAAGAAAYPALAKNGELASSGYVARMVINGQGAMPPVGAMMSDQQVADVINYVRTHFGNAYADAVSGDEIKAARRPSR